MTISREPQKLLQIPVPRMPAFLFVNPVGAYFDGDRFQMSQSVTSIRTFGYQFENGCGTRRSFSMNPCETRLDVSFIPNSS
ncbi:hypothetical protein B1B_07341, partial [mine drainage metagenome]